MNTEELKEHWSISCTDYKEIEGLGLCGIHKYAFTFGIVTSLDESSYRGRWCYPSYEEAQIALKHWDGKGDPLGLWIKYKGEGGEYSNINRSDFKPEIDIPSPHLISKTKNK